MVDRRRTGPGPCDLDVCWRAYLRRFDIEHSFRFAKNTLGWTTPSLQNPEQADTWTWLIIAAYTQLRLARPLVNDDKMPWERPLPPGQLTPTRVRRGFRRGCSDRSLCVITEPWGFSATMSVNVPPRSIQNCHLAGSGLIVTRSRW